MPEQLNEEQLEAFESRIKNEQKLEIESVGKEVQGIKAKVEQVLNRHLQDRTRLPLEEFEKNAEKEAGVTEGYQAEYQYNDKEEAAFMIKSFTNKTLDKKEQESRLNKFKESFYRALERNMRLFPLSEQTRQTTINQYSQLIRQNNNVSEEDKQNILDNLPQNVEQYMINNKFETVKQNICYDDLNIADFIREYFAGDLYHLLLHDRAPLIELVTNQTLPAKRFVKEKSGDKCEFKDQHIELFRQEKNQPKLHLRSKFLHNFTTLIDLKASGKEYKDAKGFEKILAAQMLLGEADMIQTENFGLIEKDGKKVFAKIDHGRSFYSCVNHWSQFLSHDFNVLYSIKVDYKVLSSELNNFVKFVSDNNELIDQLIDKRANNLNKILNSKMEFTLKYISSNTPAVLNEEIFSYSNQSKEFISDKGNSLNAYFKQRLQNQIKVMKEYSEILCIMAAISDNFQDIITTLPTKFFFSQYKDPLIWAIETDKKLDGKSPLAWAIENNKQIEGEDAVKWAIKTGKKLNGKSPLAWAIENNKQIEGEDAVKWAIKTGKKLNGKNPLAWAIENNKQIKGEDAVKWAKDHDMTIGGRDPETFAHIIRDKNLSKYLKAEAQLKKTAAVLFIGILAELATVITIYCRGIEVGMTAQQQSLYFEIAVAVTITTAIALLGVVAATVGIKHHLDHSKNHTIENPCINCIEDDMQKTR